MPSSSLIPDLPNLGAGEREAISLAITPDSLVILDDALARSYAQQLNLSITETLGGSVEKQAVRIRGGAYSAP